MLLQPHLLSALSGENDALIQQFGFLMPKLQNLSMCCQKCKTSACIYVYVYMYMYMYMYMYWNSNALIQQFGCLMLKLQK